MMTTIIKKVINKKNLINILLHLISIYYIGHDDEQGTTGNNQQSTSSDNQPLPPRQTNQS